MFTCAQTVKGHLQIRASRYVDLSTLVAQITQASRIHLAVVEH